MGLLPCFKRPYGQAKFPALKRRAILRRPFGTIVCTFPFNDVGGLLAVMAEHQTCSGDGFYGRKPRSHVHD